MSNLPRVQRLWLAASEGNLELVKELASDRAVDVNWCDAEFQRTPFYRACFYGHRGVVEYLLGHPRVDVTLIQSQGCSPFFIACQNGHVKVVSVLLADPRIDVNQKTQHEASPFFIACQNGHVEVVTLLLGYFRIEVNSPKNLGISPFYIACENGQTGVVAQLLTDPRIEVNCLAEDRTSPLWLATQNGHIDIVRMMMASERVIETRVVCTFNRRTAAEQGRAMGLRTMGLQGEEEHLRKKINGPLIADLIGEYEEDREAVSLRLRCLPGIREHFVARTFALVVFFADGYLRLGQRSPAIITRFLWICARLPQDLQMVLCHRMFGSVKDVILSKESEPGFRWLARPTTLWEETKVWDTQ